MKHPLSFLAGALSGALVAYYLDAVSGGRRRALVRDKLVSAGHQLSDLTEFRAKRAVGHVKGFMATGHLDRITHAEPASDQQLHDRIRARLGRVISHAKAVQVEVHDGQVCLRGQILRREVDPLLREIERIAGVTGVRHELEIHEIAEGVPALQGRSVPPGASEQREVQRSSH